MNATARTAQHLATALSGALAPQPIVSLAPALRDFAGIDATSMDAIASAGQSLIDARYGGFGSLKHSDFVVLEDFVDFLRGEFALCGIARRNNAADVQHSPDESHYLDRERL